MDVFDATNPAALGSRYALGQVIGRGRHAVVRRATHTFTGTAVAVKVIDKNRVRAAIRPGGGTRDKLLEREVGALKLTQHPYVIRLLEVVDSPDVLYMVMELGDCDMLTYVNQRPKAPVRVDSPQAKLSPPKAKATLGVGKYDRRRAVYRAVLIPEEEGEDGTHSTPSDGSSPLPDHLIDRNPPPAATAEEAHLPEPEARLYFAQIATGLAHCHARHVAHRDLKLENVIHFPGPRSGSGKGTAPSGTVCCKLTDFGLSASPSPGGSGRFSLTPCGTLAYTAPEILLADAYDATLADIWSLGVLLYMLVAGKCPFLENNDNETITMIIDCKYTMPPHISKECKNLIKKMLVKDPNKRAKLEEILHDPWLLKGQTPSQALEEEETLISRSDISEDDHAAIVKKMVEGDIATEGEINRSLEHDSYDHVTATYYLLAEKRLKKSEPVVVPSSSVPSLTALDDTPPPKPNPSVIPVRGLTLSAPEPVNRNRMVRSYSTGLRLGNRLLSEDRAGSPLPPSLLLGRRSSPMASGVGLGFVMNRSRSTPRLSPHPGASSGIAHQICPGYGVHKIVPEEKYPTSTGTSFPKLKTSMHIKNSVPTKIFEEVEMEEGVDDESIGSESMAESESPAHRTMSASPNHSRTDVSGSHSSAELQRSQMTYMFNRLDKFRFSPSFGLSSSLDKSSHYEDNKPGPFNGLFSQKRQSSLKESLFLGAGSSLEEILEEEADNEYMDASTEPEWAQISSSQTLPSTKKQPGRPTILAPPFVVIHDVPNTSLSDNVNNNNNNNNEISATVTISTTVQRQPVKCNGQVNNKVDQRNQNKNR